MALLDLAARWGRGRGRPILAFSVDHGLHPDSGRWTAFAGAAALGAGADWRALAWTGDKPAVGLPAAARAARHGLIADAARAEGARVVLFAHTADDLAEEQWMRDHGSTLGRLRDWGPSPAWPQGRGLMLLRPLLAERRQTLRNHLRSRALDWLEDPANADPRFARARARVALAASPPSGAQRDAAVKGRGAGEGPRTPSPACALWTSAIALPRAAPAAALAAALLCAAGAARPPRGERLARLHARLGGAADGFTATLAGARVRANGDEVLVAREPGRGGLPVLDLPANEPVAWDGRFEILTDRPGWRVAAAAGRAAALDEADRRILKGLPPAVRPVLPVLFRDGEARPVLAWRGAAVRALAPARLAAALGRIAREAEIDHPLDGETPPSDLF